VLFRDKTTADQPAANPESARHPKAMLHDPVIARDIPMSGGTVAATE
jgi:hypothetical protein